MAETTLALAFIPLAVIAAKLVIATLRPARHRPFVFFFGGSFLLLFGLLGGYSLRPALQSGIVSFTSRQLGFIHASASQNPIGFWAIIFVLYVLAIFVSAVGLAGIGLVFRKRFHY